MSSVLEGVKVIEFCPWAMGPIGCRHLADMGADIIKIESTTGGDPMRGIISVRHIASSDFNYPFEYAGRNKRSIAIDARTEKGREVIYKLIEKADIFVTSYQKQQLFKVVLAEHKLP